ncbi:oligomeric Golgi complex subunit 6 [Pelagophyceae sp. CCMP2097]|nr:oligomeric Golgi complex subunit 6 [Pelagophyceae sp. CCMP2097]|mmetsp:Transcript_32231/g.111424  ORF Transcript_32231/g.111424 Transcript_32231/m.111424 type:complete len:701 (-) Transcript_32231:779-2881(-)
MSSTAVLEKKVARIVNLRTDTPEMSEALATVGELWGGDTAETRRNLRSDLERRNVEVAEAFVLAFAPVRAALLQVDSKTASLEARAQDMLAQVQSADKDARRLVAEYDGLSERRAIVAKRLQRVEAFRKRYHLTPEDLDALREGAIDAPGDDAAGDDAGDNAFFAAFARARGARDECTAALQSRGSSPLADDGDVIDEDSMMPRGAAAFELLEALAAAEEAAYDRLFAWVLFRFGASQGKGEIVRLLISAERDAVEPQSALRRAMRALASREAMFDECRAACLSGRKEVLQRRFELWVQAPQAPQARGREDDAPRAVGDMLAWAHEALASEHDFARNLFFDDTANAAAEAGIVGDVIGALGAPLAARVTAALAAVGDAAQLHKAAQLLEFYTETFRKPSESLSKHVAECAANAAARRSDAVQRFVSAVDVAMPAKFQDREPTCTLVGDAATLVGSLRDADAAMSDGAGETALDAMLRAVLGAVLAALERCLCASAATRAFKKASNAADFVGTPAAETEPPQTRLSHWSPQLAAAVVVNNAHAVRRALVPHHSSAELELSHSAEAVLDSALDSLARHEAADKLRQCGLDAILDFARHAALLDDQAGAKPAGGAAAEHVDTATLSTALRTFYSSLFSLRMPGVELVAEPQLRDRARTAVAALLADAHEAIHAVAMDEHRGAYDDTSFLVHSPQQVRVLLDCD